MTGWVVVRRLTPLLQVPPKAGGTVRLVFPLKLARMRFGGEGRSSALAAEVEQHNQEVSIVHHAVVVQVLIDGTRRPKSKKHT